MMSKKTFLKHNLGYVIYNISCIIYLLLFVSQYNHVCMVDAKCGNELKTTKHNNNKTVYTV